jgi:two-component system, sensor histidine kinase
MSKRFEVIAEQAARTKAMAFLGLTGMVLIILALVCFLRRHVLGPILRMAASLRQIRSKNHGTTPPTRIKELHAIQSGLEKHGPTLAEVSKNTQELKSINQALEREIDVRRRTEQDLSIAKEAAEAADEAKSRFLASMSHEIRTPLNSILGMADLLGETPLNTEQQNYVRIFKSSSQTLLELVDDILDLSKIESGRLELERIVFDLPQMIVEIMEALAPAVQRKNLDLSSSIATEVPGRILGDPYRLRQILLNLLGNSVKFTSFGEIRLLIDTPDPRCPQTIRFRVSDTGIGIPADLQRHVFSMFTQADSSTTRKHGGTGLGLAISSRLAELMQGRIEVESEPGKGSLFTFTARFSPAPALEKEAARIEDAEDEEDAAALTGGNHGRKVVTCPESKETVRGNPRLHPEATAGDDPLPRRLLLVDDSENNRMLILWYLKDMPYVVDIALNGQEAVELFSERLYDIVLMDIQMPVMDGIAATRLIRAMEREQGLQPTPILSLSANARKEDEQMCIEAGCTGFLAKPVKRGDLVFAVERICLATCSPPGRHQ